MGHALGNNYGKFYGFLSKPVILDLSFKVQNDDSAGLGVTNIVGQGVENVFMHTTQTPGRGPNGYLNPNPLAGYALIQLAYNYNKLYGGPLEIQSPVTGSDLAINASALTAHTPYQITSVGHGEAGTATIAPVADSAGSLASTWFSLFDNYGNTFIIWFSVSGVGRAPVGTGGILVQQSIATNDSAGTIGAALAITIAALPSGVAGVFSFTATGTTTVTVVSTQHNPYQPLPGAPAEGAIPTGFTFAVTKYTSNLQDWQAVGVPPGVVPAVGVSFIATAVGYSTGGGSTGLVKALGVSGLLGYEILGNPSLSINPIPMSGSPNNGGWILLKLLDPAGAVGAPANTSILSMQLLLEQAARVGGNNE